MGKTVEPIYYDTEEELLAAETNGYVVVVVVVTPDNSARDVMTRVCGPYDTKVEAQRVASRQRSLWRRLLDEEGKNRVASIRVEHLWKTLLRGIDSHGQVI